MFDRLKTEMAGVEEALTELDPLSMIGSQPAAGIELLTRHERVIAAARAALTARAAAMNHWQHLGYNSFEDWYAATTGTSHHQAKKRTRTAENLTDQHKVADALAGGEISEDQADVITDAAAGDPDAQGELLNTARNPGRSHKDLKDRAAKTKAAAESDEARARRLRRGRTARWGIDRDGFWTLHAKLQPEVGAEIKSRLQGAVDRIFTAARKTGRREPRDRYQADAVAAVINGHHPHHPTGAAEPAEPAEPAENPDNTDSRTAQSDQADPASDQHTPTAGPAAKRHGPENEDPGSDATDHDSTGPVPTSRTDTPDPVPTRPDPDTAGETPSPRAPGKELVIDINLEALRRGCVNPGETCNIRGVGPVPVEVARRWADDAFIKAVIRDGVDVKKVVHYGRHIPAVVRTALDLTDTACAVPGCSNPRIEYDHDRRHTDGGGCSTANLRPLCAHHHRQRTHHGYELTGQPDDWRWHHPDGHVLFADNPHHLTTNPDRAP